MAVRSCDERAFWDLDVRPLDGYSEVEDFGAMRSREAETEMVSSATALQNERAAPKKAPSPAPRPSPRNPNRAPVVVPATAYTPGVLNCVRGAPPRRVVPKKPR